MCNSCLRPDLSRAQAQLDDLPHGSVILDRYNDAWQLSRHYWYRAYGDSSEVRSWELAHRGPVKTIWKPSPK